MFATKKHYYHILAIITVFIWGITFVSTKVLIIQGLSPIEILIYRFLLAYICIWVIRPQKLFANSWKDEVLCIAAGLGGGSMYFLFENTALKITLASNVSLIICTAPIFTAFLTRLFYQKEKIKPHLIIGSIIALVGVGLVVFNGNFILKISPLGDFLTILAALSWAFYGVILMQLNKRYSTFFIIRKVFIYGILTIMPFAAMMDNVFNPHLLLNASVISNIAFLGIVASLLCYITWNTAIKKLGVVQTTNYVYLVPLITLITSSLVIHEQITYIAIIGSAFILAGVYIAERGFRLRLKP